MKHWLRSNRWFLGFLLFFGLFRTAIADWNPIPSGSMRPNLLEGDVVLVNRVAFDLKVPLTHISISQLGEPKRGDIVTFFSPKDGKRTIKRIVGLPGDTIEMRDKVVIVDGRRAGYADLDLVSEPIAEDRAVTALRLSEKMDEGTHRIQWLRLVAETDSFGPITIPAEHYWMMGDNRDNSADSRSFGLVPRRLLIGRAERILVSADINGDWHPRFERFGQRLN